MHNSLIISFSNLINKAIKIRKLNNSSNKKFNLLEVIINLPKILNKINSIIINQSHIMFKHKLKPPKISSLNIIHLTMANRILSLTKQCILGITIILLKLLTRTNNNSNQLNHLIIINRMSIIKIIINKPITIKLLAIKHPLKGD